MMTNVLVLISILLPSCHAARALHQQQAITEASTARAQLSQPASVTALLLPTPVAYDATYTKTGHAASTTSIRPAAGLTATKASSNTGAERKDEGAYVGASGVNHDGHVEAGDAKLSQQPSSSLTYSSIVVFGDSLSDTHNLYDATNGSHPYSQWYYQGSKVFAKSQCVSAVCNFATFCV